MDNYFLNLHNKTMETGNLDKNGLCSNILEYKYYKIFKLFEPSDGEMYDLQVMEGMDTDYWASGLYDYDSIAERMYKYTPLRQTIVLLCHEILNDNGQQGN